MAVIVEVARPNGLRYLCPDYHRTTRRTGKSYWTIKVSEEITVFDSASTQGWLINGNGWGLYITQGGPEYLGKAQDHVRDVFISRYREDSLLGRWHGYPADYVKNPEQDTPDVAVLDSWLTQKFLPKAKIRKIAGGELCSL